MSDSQIAPDDLTPIQLCKREIEQYEKDTKKWDERSRKIERRYMDDRGDAAVSTRTRFNILYSNVQTLLPAAYGKNPKADIERRFRDDDVLGRVASDVLERCTDYYVQTERFGSTVRKALLDRLLSGRGSAWVRYVPHFKDVELQSQPKEVQEEGSSITDDVSADDEVQPQTMQQIYYEEVVADYIHRLDFGHNKARVWHEVYLIWKKAYLDREELIERFGKEIGSRIKLDYVPKSDNNAPESEVITKATIYELWNEKKKCAYWLHMDEEDFLDEQDDPLQLMDFWPCPKPLYATLDNNSLIPTPDYAEYQDQAQELDEITARIAAITKSIKVVGVYDASAPALERLLSEGYENMMIPVENWTTFTAKGGLQNATSFLEVKPNVEALLALYNARDKVKSDLNEISGIADIIRGDTKASETATAQRIKGQYATLRLSDLQGKVDGFAKDLVKKMAVIIAKHFTMDTIKKVSGVQLMTAQEKQQFLMQRQLQQQQLQQQTAQQPPIPSGSPALGNPPPPPPQLPPIDDKTQELLDNPTWEEVEALFRDEPALCFKIDIETDSTLKADQQEDQQARVEFLTAAGQFMQQMKDAPPEALPLLAEMLIFGVRGFKVGKQIEGQFRVFMNKIEKQAANPQPRPNPEMMKIQMQADEQKARAAADQQESQADLQVKLTEMKQQAMLKEQEMQMNYAFKDRELEQQMQMKDKEAQMNHALELKKHTMTTGVDESGIPVDTLKHIEQLAQQVDSRHAALNQGMGVMANVLQAIHDKSSKPKTVSVMGSDGKLRTATVQ